MPVAADQAAARPTNTPEVFVWDPLVRAGHWLLVVLFLAAYFTEDDLLTIHSWAGYGVGIYLIVRVVWGFIGPKHARFSDFAHGPASAVRYLRQMALFQAKRYIGHSPAGALMIFALLICLALTTVSGLALLAVDDNAGPLAPWLGRGAAVENCLPDLALFAATARASDDDEEHGDNDGGIGSDILNEIHEFVSNLTLFLVVLHIAGVILTSLVHRENLVRAMITGRKRAV